MHIYRSPEPDIEVPVVDLLTLLFDTDQCLAREDTILHAEAANPQNHITKSQARDLVRRIAYLLRTSYGIGSSGLGRDVVLCTSSGNPLLPVVFYSVVAAGGVFSGASTAFTVGELEKQVNSAAAKVLVCSPEHTEHSLEVARRCGIALQNVLVLRCEHNQSAWGLISAATGIDVLSRSCVGVLDWQRMTDTRITSQTTICLLYSSGTTGLPKGVRLSHRNLVSSCACIMRAASRFLGKHRAEHGRSFEFRTIAHLPMAHIAGVLNFSLQPFYLGGTTYWIPKYDFDKFVDYSKHFQITNQFSVPPVWLQVANHPSVTDQFDSMQVASTGAAPMGPELVRQVSAKLGKGKCWLGQTWGTTETDGSITMSDWTDRDETGSVGPLMAGVTLRVLSDDNKDVAPGETGEFLVSGPIVSQGYHNNELATRESFVDGYYRTGDVGYCRHGLVYIVDRKKELIKYKGLQVAPAELEALLLSHPKVADAAVIGVHSDLFASEVPRAYVVPQVGPNVDEDELKAFVKANLASHKQLRGGVVFTEQIPKSASGKILRKALRDPKAKL